jgi:antitoxin ParD1/3/4
LWDWLRIGGSQDYCIKAQVEGGDYTNDSEYIRDLIRREQERGAEIEKIRSALIEGEKSGKPKRFDANAFKRRLCRGSRSSAAR